MKAPGPDGLQGFFYRKYWHIVGPSVISMVECFFVDGCLHPELNRTYIVLIPKRKSPINIKEYRPISLCNFALKIITKFLANRLRPFLDRIISPCQHAFVPNRSIFDAILLNNEIFHSFRKKKA